MVMRYLEYMIIHWKNFLLVNLNIFIVLAVRLVKSWAHTAPRKKQPGTLQIMHEFLHAVLDMQLESSSFFPFLYHI